MEVRRQDKEIGIPTNLGYDLQKRESSSRLTSTPFAQTQTVEEKIRDETIQREETSSIPPQTLDQNHPTYHLHHHHHFPPGRQLNPLPQFSGKPGEDPDPKRPDLGSAPTTPVAGRLTSKTPPQPAGSTALTVYSPVRYRECLKNHAASTGGYVLDGCGEFMPTGEETSVEDLKCAACDCHRNFHRKEVDGGPSAPYLANCYDPYSWNNTTIRRSDQRLAPPLPHLNHQRLGSQAPMMMVFGSSGGAAAGSSSEDLAREYQAKSSKKRFRTKFTQEQKDKMMEFAERLGWKIQKHDEEEVQQFCTEAGVKRQVLKVWMHNNKPAIKKHQL